jgi:protein-disulfide isomerase
MGQALNSSVNQEDHRVGHLRASAVLVEYGDFECPHCAKMAPTIDEFLRDFGSDFCFVYRHFPVSVYHPHAMLAALASEAADEQGKFWSMHHALFRNSASLSREKIYDLARELKLDQEIFELDMMRPDLLEKVKAQMHSATKSEVRGTPSFFINGEKYLGEISKLRQKIQLVIDEDMAHFSL